MQTFLFTDIESSTRLWEEHPDAMAAALARHDSILESIVVGRSGTVIKTTGDGLVAVFGSLEDAVFAALGIQQSLSQEAWDGIEPLRVRMGLHSGEAQSRAGDYFGPTMNRAARIMAAGHGGQILISGLAAEQIQSAMPDGASLRDLGPHRLKDLTAPERIYQLIHRNLRSDFPDLATVDSRPNNLPSQATEFLGRTVEIDAIRLMLEADSTRLLTLAGPGGAGKTRLALQIGAEMVGLFPDGVFFVDLSLEKDPESAYESIVRALDLPTSGDGDPIDVLKARLRDRSMLLILDNFEQVIQAANGVNDLLQACPQLKVLVTSRETLRIRVERVFPVPPLSLPDPRQALASIAESEAVQLFVDRAQAVRPDFTLSDDNAVAVAEVCLRLDGLPLAIELAAARLNVFSPADLLSRLQDRLDSVGAGGRDLPDRQRTLWGAIGWSYELLDADEREVFEMMAVFSRTDLMTIEDVGRNALGDVSIVDGVASLVDKSLLRSDVSTGKTTFTMLLMIKEYAEDRLARDPEREQSVRQAHARHFSEFASSLQERLRGPGRETVLAELAAEVGNLRTAWRHWVDLGDLEELFNLLDCLWTLHEAKGWYHAAIELAKDTLGVLATAESSPDLAQEEMVLRTSLARALMAVRGYDEEVEEAFKAALAVSEASENADQAYPVLRALASYYTLSGNLGEALVIGKRLLQLGEDTGDETIEIEGHYVVGMAISFADADFSLPHLERVIERYDPTRHGGNRFRLGPDTGVLARTAAAMTYWLAGDLERAVNRIDDALAVAQQVNHPYSLAYALYHNGYLAFHRARFDECLAFAHSLAVVAKENEYEIWETLAVVLEGVAVTGLGDPSGGLTKTETGIRLYSGLTTPPVFWPFLLGLRAFVHYSAGAYDRGVQLVDEALDLGREDASTLPGLGMIKADLLQMTEDPDHAEIEAIYLEDIQIARQLNLRLVDLQATSRLVAFRRRHGISPDGTDDLAQVYAMFDEDLAEHDLIVARQLIKET